jgi:hypothetical protein
LQAAIMVLLGVWGWDGAVRIGKVWPALGANILVAGFTALALTVLVRLKTPGSAGQWSRIFRLEWLYAVVATIYEFFCRIAEVITSSLEGEGGLLWSLLLLALIFSILSTQAH